MRIPTSFPLSSLHDREHWRNVKNYIFARKQLFVSFFFFFFSINNRRTRAIIAWITIHKPYLGGIIDERVAAWRDSPLVFSLFLVCTPTHARRCPRGYKLLRRSGPGAKSAAVPIRNYKRCRSSTLPSNRLRLLRLLFAFFPPPPPPQPPRLTALFFSPPLLFFFPRSARSNRLIVLVTGPRSTHATTLAFLRRGPVQLFIATTCLPSPSFPVPSAPFWSFPFSSRPLRPDSSRSLFPLLTSLRSK